VSNENTANSPTFSGLPRQLVSLGLLSQEDAQSALSTAEESKKDFLTVAVSEHELEPRRIAQLIGAEFGMPVFDVSALDPESLPTDHSRVGRRRQTRRASPITRYCWMQ